MAQKIRLTRPELKRQREDLARFANFLPTLKLKKQQLQAEVHGMRVELRTLTSQQVGLKESVRAWARLLDERTSLRTEDLCRVKELTEGRRNVAGIELRTFQSITFEEPVYSLFSTPPWVDRARVELRQLITGRERIRLLRAQQEALEAELRKVTQRVNLFEKVKIPEARGNIRRISIYLGDQQTAAVGRAKIAKGKLQTQESGGQP